MKTKVRITEHPFNLSEYRFFYIDILTKRFPGGISSSLTVAGTISFQTDISRNDDSKPWYGLTYVLSTDTVKHIHEMAKIAAFIEKNAYSNVQPFEIFSLLNAEQHIIYNGDFIPVSWKGRNAYKVIRENDGGLWTIIYAVNEIMAIKQAEKLKLQFPYTVVLLEENILKNL